jgi:hypothetical protein
MVSEKQPNMIGSTIGTAMGEATYSHTEVEDDQGRWNDSWYFKNGEVVIHDGTLHHVYIVGDRS